MENMKYSLRPGLKKARKKKNLKQADLADLMGVTIKTVMNWEQGVSNPDLETTIVLANLLECDVDYLVGRIEELTHDVHEVHEITGLSEEAIRRIIELDKWFHAPRVLSELLMSEELPGLLSAYASFRNLISSIKILDGTDFTPWSQFRIRGDGKIVLSSDEAVRHYMNETSTAMRKICEEDWKRVSKEKRVKTYDPEDLPEEIAGIETEIKYLTDYVKWLKSDDFPNIPDET